MEPSAAVPASIDPTGRGRAGKGPSRDPDARTSSESREISVARGSWNLARRAAFAFLVGSGLVSLAAAAFFASGPVQAPKFDDLAPVLRIVAASQGVEIGSAKWIEGGSPAYGGTTGGHSSYGFRHRRRLAADPGLRRAAISNAAARPAFVHAEPVAYHADYERAGRPIGWAPRFAWDLASGPSRFAVPAASLGAAAPLYPDLGAGFRAVDVTGLDPSHWWPEILVDLARIASDAGLESPFAPGVAGLPPTRSTALLARELVALQAQAAAGTVRTAYGRSHFHNERFLARLLDGALSANSVAALFPRDAEAIDAWIRDGVARELAEAPGFAVYRGPRPFASPPIVDSREFGLAWQWAWSGAALDRLATEFPAFEPVVGKAAERFLRWTVDATDAEGRIASLVSFAPGEVESWTAPPDSIAALLASGRAARHVEYDFDLWAFVAYRHAARRGIPRAAEIAARILARAPAGEEADRWLVDERREFLRPASAAVR